MKKALILSLSTGQGHNSCALAIQEYFDHKGVTCDIRDAFDFSSPHFSRFMSWGHATMYRYFPWLFRLGYQYSKTHPSFFKESGWVYKTLVAGTEKMYRYLLDGHYDTVICTHVLTGMMLTHLLKQHPMEIRTAFVATDYTDYPGLDKCDLQTYFLADQDFVPLYASWGIPKNKLMATGIPVRKEFVKRLPKEDAKRQLGIDEQNKHLLVMCGSMGCGPMEEILKHLAKNLPGNIEVSVICGSNKHLYQRLSRRYQGNRQIHIVGYTKQISLYMDSADLYLTKPGGISLTEATVKKLPMVLVNAVAGCESDNLKYYLSIGGAVTADSAKMLAMECIWKLQSDESRSEMEKALLEHSNINGAQYTYAVLKKGV